MQRRNSQDSEVVDLRAKGECFVYGVSTEGWGRDRIVEALCTSAMCKDQEVLLLDINSLYDVIEWCSRMRQ
jgi:hypothetical protein